MLNEIRTSKLVQSSVLEIKDALVRSRVLQSRDPTRFVFLCGANKSSNDVSERRRALLDFAQRSLPGTQFFLAEKTFEILQELGHRGNILDVEHLISQFSDYVVIVLESPSAFAELGAFAHDRLRKKLIVINDSRFANTKSFINLGPLAAIKEAAGQKPVIQYPMKSDGIHMVDAIGDVFQPLFDILGNPSRTKSEPLPIEICDPSENFGRESAMFVHDLVFMTGPIRYKELIELLKQIFGSKSFNQAKQLLALLTAISSVERSSDQLFRSRRDSPYLDFRIDTASVMSTFRNAMQRNYPERFYEYQAADSK